MHPHLSPCTPSQPGLAAGGQPWLRSRPVAPCPSCENSLSPHQLQVAATGHLQGQAPGRRLGPWVKGAGPTSLALRISGEIKSLLSLETRV